MPKYTFTREFFKYKNKISFTHVFGKHSPLMINLQDDLPDTDINNIDSKEEYQINELVFEMSEDAYNALHDFFKCGIMPCNNYPEWIKLHQYLDIPILQYIPHDRNKARDDILPFMQAIGHEKSKVFFNMQIHPIEWSITNDNLKIFEWYKPIYMNYVTKNKDKFIETAIRNDSFKIFKTIIHNEYSYDKCITKAVTYNCLNIIKALHKMYPKQNVGLEEMSCVIRKNRKEIFIYIMDKNMFTNINSEKYHYLTSYITENTYLEIVKKLYEHPSCDATCLLIRAIEINRFDIFIFAHNKCRSDIDYIKIFKHAVKFNMFKVLQYIHIYCKFTNVHINECTKDTYDWLIANDFQNHFIIDQEKINSIACIDEWNWWYKIVQRQHVYGSKSLHYAIYHNNIEVVKYIIENIEVEHIDKKCIECAIYHSRKQIFIYLSRNEKVIKAIFTKSQTIN